MSYRTDMAPCFKQQGTGIKKLTIGGRTLTMKPRRTDMVLAVGRDFRIHKIGKAELHGTQVYGIYLEDNLSGNYQSG